MNDHELFFNQLERVIPNFWHTNTNEWKYFLNSASPDGKTWRTHAHIAVSNTHNGYGIKEIYHKYLENRKNSQPDINIISPTSCWQSQHKTTSFSPKGGDSFVSSYTAPADSNRKGNSKISKHVVDKKALLDGFVYCLSNPSMPGLLKIGFTKKSPHERVRELNKSGGTALPAPYQVEFFYECNDPQKVENKLHTALAKKRYRNNREFFLFSVKEAKISFAKYVPEPRKRFA